MQLGLSPEALDALRRARFAQPTPIQSRAIPPALAGKDVIGCAATGTGKTAAYVLPLVERFAGRKGTLGLVLAPTRELALQVAGWHGVHAEAEHRDVLRRGDLVVRGEHGGRRADRVHQPDAEQ